MMHDARYAQKRHTSYPTSAYECDHVILTQKRTQSCNSYSNSKQKQANEGLQICLLISSKIFRDSCLFNFILHAILHLSF